MTLLLQAYLSEYENKPVSEFLTGYHTRRRPKTPIVLLKPIPIPAPPPMPPEPELPSIEADWPEIMEALMGVMPFKIPHILIACARHYEITVNEMTSHKRTDQLVMARQTFAVLAKGSKKLSYLQIGKKMCRDHTSILHLYRTAPDRPGLADAIRAIVATLQGTVPKNQLSAILKLVDGK